jgi:hypothetical protein
MSETNHVNVRDNDQSILQHSFDDLHSLIDFDRGVYCRNHDWAVMSRVKKALPLVRVSFGAVAENPYTQLPRQCPLSGALLTFAS